MNPTLSRTARLLLAALLLLAGAAQAAEVIVMSSGGFYSAMEVLGPMFEKETGHKVVLVSGSSMGASDTSIPARLGRGEPADVVMLAGTELEKLMPKYAVPGSRVDLVHSKIGMMVRAGAPRPDISTKDTFELALRRARSIGYSASASGTHLKNEVFPRLGIAEYHAVTAKSTQIVKDRVATWVGRGDVEIGFQQVGEIVVFPEVTFVGLIPAPYQRVTTFSAGVAVGSKQPEAGQALIRFLTSPAQHPVLQKLGLEPASSAVAAKK